MQLQYLLKITTPMLLSSAEGVGVCTCICFFIFFSLLRACPIVFPSTDYGSPLDGVIAIRVGGYGNISIWRVILINKFGGTGLIM